MQASLSEQAYDKLEMLIVTSDLAPGERTKLSELEEVSGFRRTPVHDAVKRLAVARLIQVLPRAGLRIAPLDLEEERLLLPVRIEMEALAAKLAAQRADTGCREALAQTAAMLAQGSGTMSLAEFNVVDRDINALVLKASDEPLLGNTLMPLQTLYRRSGWLFHSRLGSRESLDETIAMHLTLVNTVLNGDPIEAEQIVRSMLSEVYGVLAKLSPRPRAAR
ncbi:GntR family transcriptional regulator [Sphingomonas sp. AP4-R1]|uniref:GntR family transcriptional regulator n=1 Tax=Sphingomonas sp. AP4-R1 TaxID=2735134 RepID=UPI0014934B6B|nr:GntR family transcriptional regulator [Sphingomonas sp. AP4-R1]QJU58302.1 GntR family transcriptional regulator [Sphingomonas sp. AP4-R1]